MDSNNHTVACGYQNCDLRYEYCSTAFGTPECLSCSRMCSHYRIVNDPVATARCQSLCPEYWRRMQTTPSIEATSQTLADFSMGVTSDEYRTLKNLLIVQVVLIVLVLFVGLHNCTLLQKIFYRYRYFQKIYSLLCGLLPAKKAAVCRQEDPEDPSPLRSKSLSTETRSDPGSNTTNNKHIGQPVQDPNNNDGVLVVGTGRTVPIRNYLGNSNPSGSEAPPLPGAVAPPLAPPPAPAPPLAAAAAAAAETAALLADNENDQTSVKTM